MIKAAMVLMGEDPKKSIRFFLELTPEDGFNFITSGSFEIPKLEELVNKKFQEMKKKYKVSIKIISSNPEKIYQAICIKFF